MEKLKNRVAKLEYAGPSLRKRSTRAGLVACVTGHAITGDALVTTGSRAPWRGHGKRATRGRGLVH